jgi:hypothetical protein
MAGMDDAASGRRADPFSWAVFAALAAAYRFGRCPSYGSPADSAGTVWAALNAPGRDPVAWAGRALGRLPLDTAMGWANFMSGLCSAGAAALLYAVLRRLGLRRVPALTAAVLLAFAPVWRYWALAAGHAAPAALGLALIPWGVAAWKDSGRARPLLAAALGGLLLASAAPRAASLAPSALWAAAFAAGLLLQRLQLASEKAALAALAAVLLVPVLAPWSLRRHDPLAEYARAALSGLPPGASVAAGNEAVYRAMLLEDPAGLRVLPPGADADFVEAVAPPDGRRPRGLLLERGAPLAPAEAARRAGAVLALPALDSVARRDRSRYRGADEGYLYARYRAVLSSYRDALGARDAALKARLGQALEQYGPGPSP